MLGSGSSGNALLVESACGTRVLVEAGLGPRTVVTRLRSVGVELDVGGLSAIIATHHHGDHFGYAGMLSATFNAPLLLHPGLPEPEVRPRRGRRALTEEQLPISTDEAPSSFSPQSWDATDSPATSRPPLPRPPSAQRYDIGRPLRVQDLTITTVSVPHDAAQIALRVDDGTSAFGVATDIGRVTPALVGLLAECDGALVEANHCAEMLAFSEYPDVVKRRVSGGLGHLSNDQAAELGARLVGSRLGRLTLGHLSRSNNTPQRALETVATRARRIAVEVLDGTSAVTLIVRAERPHQLGLRF